MNFLIFQFCENMMREKEKKKNLSFRNILFKFSIGWNFIVKFIYFFFNLLNLYVISISKHLSNKTTKKKRNKHFDFNQKKIKNSSSLQQFNFQFEKKKKILKLTRKREKKNETNKFDFQSQWNIINLTLHSSSIPTLKLFLIQIIPKKTQ